MHQLSENIVLDMLTADAKHDEYDAAYWSWFKQQSRSCYAIQFKLIYVLCL